MKGFAGQSLSVDLTTGVVGTAPTDEDLARAFIGGQGIDLRMAFDKLRPGIDPLSPENCLLFSSGPLVGTQLGTRFSSLCKNPLTGAIAFGSGGMAFGPRLKWAGYDQIAITGEATHPVYLRIADGETEICDARSLWGRDVYETTDELWRRLGRLYSIIAIGTAGENRVPASVAFVDRCSSLGKGGLAAVMGAKNLKAVAVKGSRPVTLADPERFRNLRDRIFRLAEQGSHSWIKYGKMSMTVAGSPSVPYRNNTEVFPKPLFTELYGKEVYLNEIMGKRVGCTGCPYPCKDVIEVRTESGGISTVNVSSLVGRVYNLGIQAAGGASFRDTVRMVERANRLGVDTQVFAPAMMLAVDLYKRGMITREDAGGIELKTDTETTLRLLDLVAERQGFGDVLAEGSIGIIRRFGKECEKYSFHLKGLEQQTDPRLSDFNVKAFCQVTNPEGGSLEPGFAGGNLYPRFPKGFSLDDVSAFCKRMGMDQATVDRVLIQGASPGFKVPIAARWAENFYTAVTALGVCEYRSHHFDWPIMAELFHYATGLEMDAGQMKEAAERIWNLFRAINLREGFDRRDDRFPDRWLEPIHTSDGEELTLATCEGRPVNAETFRIMLDEYYEERGWDLGTGAPGRKKLQSLGLSGIAEDLVKNGSLK